MDLGQWIVILLSVLMLGWYVIMSTYNRHLGVRAYRWLRLGLEARGEIVHARWLGTSSTGAKLVWQPFSSQAQSADEEHHEAVKELHVSYFIENREILPLWLFYHLRGQRDVLIVQTLLSRPPKETWMLKKTSETYFPQEVPEFKSKEINWQPYQEKFHISKTPSKNQTFEAALSSFLERWHNELIGIAKQKQTPHVILKMNLPSLLALDAHEFCNQLLRFLEQF